MSEQLTEGTAPPTAVDGSPPSDGPAPANGAGQVATDDAAAREKAFARKTAASFRAGKQEGQAELLSRFGYSDAEEVQRILDAHAAAREESESAESESRIADERSAIRQLKTDLRARERALDESTSVLARLTAQNERARKSELRSRLAAAGAHPEALADLVDLLHNRVEWSDEGDGLEVVDRDGSKVIPAGMTLDELISEQRERRAYMFAGQSPRGGSGTTVRTAHAPTGVSQRRETWKDRVAKARSGG